MKNSGHKQGGLFWIIFGLLLITAALSLVFYNLYDELHAEQSAKNVVDKLEKYLYSNDFMGPCMESLCDEKKLIPNYILFPNMEMPVKNIDGIDFIGILQIPTLELKLPVISQWSYINLKTAPCRYSGSAYLNNLIICGHNYKSHFGDLKNLHEGDIATFTDMDGNLFTYKMVERETLFSTSVEAMESGNWDLSLFTCTLGGQSRVTVRFELEMNGS